MASPPRRLIHKNDIGWIIELWHRIHDGDPSPEKLTDMTDRQVQAAVSQVIKQFATQLDPVKAKAVITALGH